MTKKHTDYLHATPFIDSDNPAIVAFAQNALGDADTVKEKALALYGAVRDQIQYDPYIDFLNCSAAARIAAIASRRISGGGIEIACSTPR